MSKRVNVRSWFGNRWTPELLSIRIGAASVAGAGVHPVPQEKTIRPVQRNITKEVRREYKTKQKTRTESVLPVRQHVRQTQSDRGLDGSQDQRS